VCASYAVSEYHVSAFPNFKQGCNPKKEVGVTKWRMPDTELYETSIGPTKMDHFIQRSKGMTHYTRTSNCRR